jgi:predicted acylesterase/phospholipase RssA
MEQIGVLSELKRLAGTSAGAITAAFLAVGCTSADLEVHLNRNFGNFLDSNGLLETDLIQAAQDNSYKKAAQALLREYWKGWSTLLHPIGKIKELKEKIINLEGLASGETIREWIEGIIKEKTGKKHCTFKELQELINKDPQKFKELHIFSIRIGHVSQPEVIRFSHEKPLWNDLIISDAVRASLSIPGVFRPHTLHFKNANGARYEQTQHGKFIDGGLIRNFPIDAFDDEKYQEDRHFRGMKINRRTLGLRLHDVTIPREDQIQKISSGIDLIKALVSTYYHAEEILLEKTSLYKDRTIVIPTKDVGLMDFNISQKVKEELIASGSEATDLFLDNSQESLASISISERIPSPTSFFPLCTEPYIPWKYFVLSGNQISKSNDHKLLLIDGLKTFYRKKDKVELFRPAKRDGEWKLEFPIQKIYTRLALIEDDKEKTQLLKKEDLEEEPTKKVRDEQLLTYETLFERKKPVQLEALFSEHLSTDPKKVIIFGSAGIGKSTLCQHIAYRWATEELWQDYILVWASLSNLRSNDTTETFLQREVGTPSLQKALGDKNLLKQLLLLLDGYDDIPKGCDKVFEQIKQQFQDSHLLLTTRPQPVSLNGSRFEILGFHSDDIPVYIDQFFKEVSPKELSSELAYENKAQLKKLLQSQPQVRSLCHTPINLTVLCTLFCDSQEIVNFETVLTMTSLYDRLVNWMFKRFLLRQEKSESTIREQKQAFLYNDTTQNLYNLLGELAFDAMVKKKSRFPQEQIEKKLREKGLLLSDLKTLGLLRIEDSVAQFDHLSFQEFFAATYLARLYDDPKKNLDASDFVAKHKLDNRYLLTLQMVAWILDQESDKKHVKFFFNDLFSNPQDLAFSHLLMLKAACFEECDEPENIFQYKIFIQQAVKFLRVNLNEKLKTKLLTGNQKLFFHSDIIQVFKENLKNDRENRNALEILEKLAKKGQSFPPDLFSALKDMIKTSNRAKAFEILTSIAKKNPTFSKEIWTLVDLLSDQVSDNKISPLIIYSFLGELAQSNHSFAQDALSKLTAVFSDSQADEYDKHAATFAIGGVSRSNHLLAQKARSALISIFSDPIAGDDAHSEVASTFGHLVQNGHILSDEELQALIAGLKKPILEPRRGYGGIKQSITSALGKVAKKSHFLPENTLEAALHVLLTPGEIPRDKSSAAQFLGEIVESNHPLAGKALSILISVLSNDIASRDAKRSVVNALGAVAKCDHHHFAEEALSRLIVHTPLRHSTISNLEGVAKSNHLLAEKALSELTDMLSKQKIDPSIMPSITTALWNVAQDKPFFAQKILSKLIDVWSNPRTDKSTKSEISDIMGKATKIGHPLTEGPLSNLIITLSNEILDLKSDHRTRSLLTNALEKLSAQSNPSLSDDCTISSAAYALGLAIKRGLISPEETLPSLITVFSNSQSGNFAKSSAAYALGEIAEKGYNLSEIAIDELIAILSDQTANNNAKSSATHALGIALNKGQILPEKILGVLITMLLDRSMDNKTRSSTICTLKEVAKKTPLLPETALTKLSSALSNPATLSSNIGNILGTLKDLEMCGFFFPDLILSKLTQALSNLDYNNKTILLDFLHKICEEMKYQYDDEKHLLFAKLFFLTGHVFFYEDGRFFTFAKDGRSLLSKNNTPEYSLKSHNIEHLQS